MNPITLFIASAIVSLNAPQYAPTVSTPVFFENLSSLHIRQIINEDTDQTIHIGDFGQYYTTNLPRNYNYTFIFESDVDDIRYYCDDIGNVPITNWNESQLTVFVGGGTNSCALYDAIFVEGDYYLNQYQFPFTSGEDPYYFNGGFTYPSSPLGVSYFNKIRFFNHAFPDKSYRAVLMAFGTSNNLWLPVADNFGVKLPKQFITESDINNLIPKSDKAVISNQMLYYNGCDNHIILDKQEIAVRDPFYYDYDFPTYLSKIQQGFFAYDEGSNETVMNTLDATFTLITKAIGAALPIFTIMIFPGISLGLLLFIPLMFALVMAVVKLIKS